MWNSNEAVILDLCRKSLAGSLLPLRGRFSSATISGSRMSEEQQKLPQISNWDAQLLRLTAYPVDPEAVDADRWWEELTGNEPESVTKKKLERQYEGLYENAGLQLTINPVVVQWNRFPALDPMDLSDEFPNVGTFPVASTSFASMMEKWLKVSPPLKRLALGTVLLQPVENHESGYRLLNDYLPFVQLDPDTSDFNFKINRRRPSNCGIEGLKINRLMNWSLLRWKIDLNVSQGGNSPRQLAPASGVACRVELDVNTVPDFEGELPQDPLIPLCQELMQLGQEIAAAGDNP